MFENASKFNIADRVGYIFSEFFGLIYPYFHNHFISYSLILAIALGLLWISIKRFKKTRSTGEKIVWAIIGLLAGSFGAWLLLFHFHTFLQADMYYMDHANPAK